MSQYKPRYLKDMLKQHIEKLGFEIGDYTYGEPPVIGWWGEKAKLRMGRYCSVGSNVRFYLGGNHRVDWVTTYPFSDKPMHETWPEAKSIEGHPHTRGDIVIGNDVWLANDSVILSGVSIGDGAVVGTRSVVTKDVAPYSIVGGNPAKFIRKRFSDDIIESLLALKWWDWEEQKVRKFIPYLCSNKIEEFLKKAGEG